MKCGMCGYEFDPATADIACGGCPLVKGCHLVRCPRCGYEMPPEAMLVKWLRRIRKYSPQMRKEHKVMVNGKKTGEEEVRI